MKKVAKYNLFKGVSTLLTIGTPIVTLLCCGDFITKNPETSISTAGIFVLLIVALFCKDKFLEEFKIPPTFIICLTIFILVCMIESIMLPIKAVCITTMITSGIDEFTFKSMYKNIEFTMPEQAKTYKHFGFIFTTSKNIGG